MNVEEISDILSQYPDVYRIGILMGDLDVPIGMTVGELRVVLARYELLHPNGIINAAERLIFSIKESEGKE